MDDMKWKILSSEYLIKRHWLTARRDVVELPDGRINKEYYVLEYPTWINVTAITKDGDMVLVRQYRHALGQTNFEIGSASSRFYRLSATPGDANKD